VAGESAREIAQRRRDKAERLHKVADAYEKGAYGEQQTAAALAMLPTSGWFVLHDVRWPGRALANIDHIVVGPGGIFVIDSKAWSGRVNVEHDVLRQNGRKRESAVVGAAEAALAVARMLGMDPALARPVLCFAGQTSLQGWARDVMLTTPENLVPMLLSRRQVLDTRTVHQSMLRLQLGLESARKAAPPAPRVRVHDKRTRPRRARRGHPLRGLLGFVVSVAVMLIGVRFLVAQADHIGQGIVGLSAPEASGATTRLGQAATFPPAAHRPPLRVRADHAATVHRVGTTPYLLDGNRFFGVRLTIRNSGRHAWTSEPGTTFQVMDASEVPHPGGTHIRIREGRMLSDPIRVPPGGVVRGYVVFQAPAAQPVTGVSVSVGPGEPATATWRIDRQ
jgi:hypothetical protein